MRRSCFLEARGSAEHFFQTLTVLSQLIQGAGKGLPVALQKIQAQAEEERDGRVEDGEAGQCDQT